MLRRSSGGAAGRTESGSSARGTGDVGKRSTSRRWHFGFTAGFRPRRACGLGCGRGRASVDARSEEHTSELQSRLHLVCRLLLEKKKKTARNITDGVTSQIA